MAYAPGMAFEPRSKVAQRSAFGQVAVDLHPATGVSPDDVLYRAAIMQHRLAYFVNEQLRLQGTKVTTYLRRIPYAPGLSPDRQLRLLRGETTATYADLMFWAGEFPRVADAMGKFISAMAQPKTGDRQRQTSAEGERDAVAGGDDLAASTQHRRW